MTAHPAHTIIDWNQTEYSGWVLYRLRKSPLSAQPVTLEWWDEPETEGAPDPNYVYTVYRDDVPDDVLAYYDWVDVNVLAQFLGTPLDELEALSRDPSPIVRASVMMDIVAYYGAQELDQYPIQLTGRELRRRWPRVFRGLAPSAMWEEARKAARKAPGLSGSEVPTGLRLEQVLADNPHGKGWKLYGTGVTSAKIRQHFHPHKDYTHFATFRSVEGYKAEYIFDAKAGEWELGAN